MSRPRIVLFGDSITQSSFGLGGWGAALAHLYSRKADIVLRGYGGYNTHWALSLMENIFPRLESPPLAVTIFFGANDAALPDQRDGDKHIPLEDYKRNLHAMISHIKAISDMTRIVLITPPPVDENARLASARLTYPDTATELPERTNQMAGEYALACRTVAHEANVPVADLWTSFQMRSNHWQQYLSDGLHLTPAGTAIVFEELAIVFEELVKVFNLTGLAEPELPLDFPLR